MAKKKNQVAAGQERARERAKRKARYAGPAIAPPAAPLAAAAPSADSPPAEAVEASGRQPVGVVTAAPALAAPRSPARASVRTAPRLTSELVRIGMVTAIVGAALAALEFATTLGA